MALVVPLPQKKKVILASTRRAGGGADARPPDQENTSSSTRSEPPSLPLEWEMKVSSTSGKTYYRHILSGKTRWTRPEGVASFSEMSWGEGAASFSADNPLARKREREPDRAPPLQLLRVRQQALRSFAPADKTTNWVQ